MTSRRSGEQQDADGRRRRDRIARSLAAAVRYDAGRSPARAPPCRRWLRTRCPRSTRPARPPAASPGWASSSTLRPSRAPSPSPGSCDRAGIDVVWVADRRRRSPRAGCADARRSRRRGPRAVAPRRDGRSGTSLAGRRWSMPSAPRGRTPAGSRWPSRGRADPGSGSRCAERRPPSATADRRRSLETSTSCGAARVVDDVVLPGWRFADLETAADEVRAEAAGGRARPGDARASAALLPVSIGRTEAEASARADARPRFAALGHPRGDRHLRDARGVPGPRDRAGPRRHHRPALPAPGAPDVHDVIAQLTAITIGTTDVLVPGSLRSPAPPPPEGWGGRRTARRGRGSAAAPDGADAAGGLEDQRQELRAQRGRVDPAGVGADRQGRADPAVRRRRSARRPSRGPPRAAGRRWPSPGGAPRPGSSRSSSSSTTVRSV